MLSKKIRKILCKVILFGMMFFTTIIPIKTFSAGNGKILLDLSHSDVMYMQNGVLIRDEGAVYNEYSEREITNQITLKVRDILQKNGIQVDLTRDFDSSISIEERVEKANKFNYDAYISLHANSCVTPNSATGVEAYSNNQYTLSSNIVKDLSEEFNLPNRGVFATPYYNINIPNSTLIELGFINNNVDRNILLNNQDEIAEIIANNIMKQYPKSETKTIETNNGSFTIKINYN